MICVNWGQQRLQPTELHTAEDGSVSCGGGSPRVISRCSQSKHKVHLRMLDVCWVSGEFWLDASAPAGWKLVFHLPGARGGLCEQDCLVQMHPRALSVSPLCSLRRSQVPSSSPYCVKGTSLHVWSCCRALLQCGSSICKKRWTWRSAAGGWLFLPHPALCCQPGRSTEWRLAEASRQIEMQPSMHRLFLSVCHKLCASQARCGNKTPLVGVFMCSKVLDQQLPFPDLLWYRNGASWW